MFELCNQMLQGLSITIINTFFQLPILLAVCDANFCFLYVDVGALSKSNDTSTFQDSLFYKKLLEGSLDLGPYQIQNQLQMLMPHF